jgi:hypothetical protein
LKHLGQPRASEAGTGFRIPRSVLFCKESCRKIHPLCSLLGDVSLFGSGHDGYVFRMTAGPASMDNNGRIAIIDLGGQYF